MRRPAIIVIIAFVLVIIGALNWGLVGLANIDLVAMIFGAGTPIARAVYVIVGISGIGVAVWLATAFKGGSDTVRTADPMRR